MRKIPLSPHILSWPTSCRPCPLEIGLACNAYGRHKIGHDGLAVMSMGVKAITSYILLPSPDVNYRERTAIAHAIGEVPFERSFRCTGK